MDTFINALLSPKTDRINPAQYINVCWDANDYKVLQLEETKKGRK